MVFHCTYLLSISLERKRCGGWVLSWEIGKSESDHSSKEFVVKEKKNGQLLEGIVGSKDDLFLSLIFFF